MASEANPNHPEIYQGEDLRKHKVRDLWEELSLPEAVQQSDIEMGHHRSSGFVWLKQKKHKFKSIGKTHHL
ncbi:hypothetical protein M0R45_013601 [Rubus argutus]|uniref:Uncharacterized protein n=1 Tax=Rubus argutus TaxID=59490 RepID=A0AAW1XJ76_RUBAR